MKSEPPYVGCYNALNFSVRSPLALSCIACAAVSPPAPPSMPDKPFDPIPTRHSLLNRLKDWGDRTSWQDFFDTYWRLIYNVAVKAGLTDTEAQEVVQETVISVAKKISEFKTDPARGSFSAWLMHTTRWRIADQFRKRGEQASRLAGAGKAG